METSSMTKYLKDFLGPGVILLFLLIERLTMPISMLVEIILSLLVPTTCGTIGIE